MVKLRTLIAGVLVALAGGYALAQVTNLVPTAFSGAETIVVAALGPASPSEYVTSGMFRNTAGGITSTSTTGTIVWPLTIVPGIASAPPAQYSSIVYTGAVGTMTQNLPISPFDGQIVQLINGQGSAWTALTVNSTDGSALVNFGAALTLAAGVSAEYFYLKSTNSWYRLR